jgi:aldehyde:ferredoxin oxidoreductase
MQNVLTYGERIWNLKRALNMKLGYNGRRAEKLPELILRPLEEGGTEGHVPDFDTMMREYYEYRRWDWETGKPLPDKLEELGMQDIAADLWGKAIS